MKWNKEKINTQKVISVNRWLRIKDLFYEAYHHRKERTGKHLKEQAFLEELIVDGCECELELKRKIKGEDNERITEKSGTGTGSL